jgi:hypothetical protein
VTAHLSPAGRARARRLDQALDQDRAAHRPDHNRDRATPHPASHADPGSRTLPGTHNGRVGNPQPNQHTTAQPGGAAAPSPATGAGAP